MREPGTRVDPGASVVEVDGRRVCPEPKVCVILNKPRGPLSTVSDERGRPTVVELVGGVPGRLYPAGRLDADSEGLLVLTNDGELALRLTHPRYGVEKVYEAEVRGRPSVAALRRLEEGVELHDGPARARGARLVRAGRERSVVELTVHSGRKRQVRRMLEAVGHRVLRLRRTRVGPLTLGRLRPGEWRELSRAEVAKLKAALGEGDASPR